METTFVKDGKTVNLGQSMLKTKIVQVDSSTIANNTAEPHTEKPPRGQKGGQKHKKKHPSQTAAREARKQNSHVISSDDDDDDEPVRNPSHRKHAAAGVHVSSTNSPAARLAKKATSSQLVHHAAANSSDPIERSGGDDIDVGHESTQRDGAGEKDVDGPDSGLFEPLDAIDSISSLDEAKAELRFVRSQLEGHLDHGVQQQQRINLLIDDKARYKAIVDGARRDTKLKLSEKISEMQGTVDSQNAEINELKAQAAKVKELETMKSAVLAMQENERLLKQAKKSIKKLQEQLAASEEPASKAEVEAQLTEAMTEKEMASAAWLMSKKAVFGA